ncbi:MAG: hypothetical protein M3R70_11705 [Actinomycetota bacterium]|nr:hypothetical protein [Actinomycetota bacterium]
MTGEPRHLLVIANETVVGQSLIDAVRKRAAEGDVQVTVIAPVTPPREGYVVYQDTRRAAAGRRLDRSVELLREAGISAHGMVVEADPVNATRDAIAAVEPDEIVVSTHPQQKSGWLRRNVVDRIRSVAGDLPVEHVVVDLAQEPDGQANVLVVANETILGEPLLAKIRARAKRSPASFLLIAPQSDVSESEHPEAERRLRRAIAGLRGDGIDAHGQVAHPDPFTAALHAVQDERIDEIIVSTFPSMRSGWLRRDLVERLKDETDLPVEHVVVEPAEAGVAS